MKLLDRSTQRGRGELMAQIFSIKPHLAVSTYGEGLLSIEKKELHSSGSKRKLQNLTQTSRRVSCWPIREQNGLYSVSVNLVKKKTHTALFHTKNN